MTGMTDRARDTIRRGIGRNAGIATVEEAAGQIREAAENLPKAATEAGVMPGDPMHELLATLGTGFGAWGDMLAAHAGRIEAMTAAAKAVADAEVARARSQVSEIEALAVQRVTESITEAADRVLDRRTAVLEWRLALTAGGALAVALAITLAAGYWWGYRDAAAAIDLADKRIAAAFQDGPETAARWADLMRHNDLKASLERCTGAALVVKDGRRACLVPLWLDGPAAAP